MVRHCGRPAARPAGWGPAQLRTPAPPPSAPWRPRRPEPRPAASVRSSAGLSFPPLPSSFAPSRPGAAATREPRRRSGAGPSREPRGVWGAGRGPRCPSPNPARGEEALGLGEGMGQRPCPCRAPSPAPLCLARDRGPGFRVRSLPPPRSRGFPLRPAGEKERLSRCSSPSSAPVPTPLKSPGCFAWGGVLALFLSPSPLDASHAFGK